MSTDGSNGKMSRAIVVLGTLLAIGLVLGAFVLGYQTRNIGSGRSSLVVKGLAEKPVKADNAEWQVTAKAFGQTFPETLQKLRQEKAALDGFISRYGFDKASLTEKAETVEPNFVSRQEGDNMITVQEGFVGRQTVVVTTSSLDKIIAASNGVMDYKASGHELEYQEPRYLVSNLEDIKMSLISAATENARKRALEFIKNSDTKLGAMRSASQGAFYILPNTADARTDDYGGVYDKSTIDKIARVVVTVEFRLE
ncbi:MAG: SIMPL domain-containing protein [Chlorobaculum sp.]